MIRRSPTEIVTLLQGVEEALLRSMRRLVNSELQISSVHLFLSQLAWAQQQSLQVLTEQRAAHAEYHRTRALMLSVAPSPLEN